MLYPRTLALVVGLAGPAAGFASIKGGSMLIEVSTEAAGPDFKKPNLKCCNKTDGSGLPDGCLFSEGGYQCVPDDICERIGVVTKAEGEFVPGGTIQTGGDWCNAAVSKLTTNEAKKAACRNGNILRKQNNVMTKNGWGVEFFPCSWDDTTDKCVLAGWSLRCSLNAENGVPEGCPGVTPVGDGRTSSKNIIVATKCSNKMEKSSLSFNANGRPRYTRAMSCAQKLLDCGDNIGVKDAGEDVDAKCNNIGGVTWTDCCMGSRRFRELEEEDQKQMAPADEKRKSRKLAGITEEACQAAEGTLHNMTDGSQCCDNSAANKTTSMSVLGDSETYKETEHAGAKNAFETCTYNATVETCTCESKPGIGNEADNCQRGNNLFPYTW